MQIVWRGGPPGFLPRPFNEYLGEDRFSGQEASERISFLVADLRPGRKVEASFTLIGTEQNPLCQHG